MRKKVYSPANYNTRGSRYVAHDSAKNEDADGYFDALALITDYYLYQQLD